MLVAAEASPCAAGQWPFSWMAGALFAASLCRPVVLGLMALGVLVLGCRRVALEGCLSTVSVTGGSACPVVLLGRFVSSRGLPRFVGVLAAAWRLFSG